MPAQVLGGRAESSGECWPLPIHYIRLLLQAEGNLGAVYAVEEAFEYQHCHSLHTG